MTNLLLRIKDGRFHDLRRTFGLNRTSSGWIGSLSSFGAGDGYWFISNSDVCFEYECVAN